MKKPLVPFRTPELHLEKALINVLSGLLFIYFCCCRAWLVDESITYWHMCSFFFFFFQVGASVDVEPAEWRWDQVCRTGLELRLSAKVVCAVGRMVHKRIGRGANGLCLSQGSLNRMNCLQGSTGPTIVNKWAPIHYIIPVNDMVDRPL